VTVPDALAIPAGLFAYGPVPGVELIPYFLALVSWVVLAIGALLLSPFTAIIRRLRRTRATPPAEAPAETAAPPPTEPAAPVPPAAPAPPTSEPSVDAPRPNG
jgi:hypothetical protein